MFAILILVILIITKHRREGADLSLPHYIMKPGSDSTKDDMPTRLAQYYVTREKTQHSAGISGGPPLKQRQLENTDGRHLGMGKMPWKGLLPPSAGNKQDPAFRPNTDAWHKARQGWNRQRPRRGGSRRGGSRRGMAGNHTKPGHANSGGD